MMKNVFNTKFDKNNLPINFEHKSAKQIDKILEIADVKNRVIFKEYETFLDENYIDLDALRNVGFYNVKTNEHIQLKYSKIHNDDEFAMNMDNLNNGWVRYGMSRDKNKNYFAYISASKKEYAKKCAKWIMNQYKDIFISYYDIEIILGTTEQPLDIKLDADLKYIMNGLSESFHSMRKVDQMIRAKIFKPCGELILFEDWDKE